MVPLQKLRAVIDARTLLSCDLNGSAGTASTRDLIGVHTMAKTRRPHMERVSKGWDPSLWASRKPFGIGEQHPNNFKEVSRALWENRDEAGFAWRILNQGVCDGCALGVAGLHDWTMDGVHLCNIRLRLLRLNTMPALDPAVLSDVAVTARQVERRAARARPPALPDGAQAWRARVHARVLG